jgi:hypothetical protein
MSESKVKGERKESLKREKRSSPYARTWCGVPHEAQRVGTCRLVPGWVAGGVCFVLGTNSPCRICPRLPATTDLLALAGIRRWEVQERECRVQEVHLTISSADSGSAE